MSHRVTGISSMATRQLLADVIEAWGRRGGCAARFESVGGVLASKRVMEGESFDLVILAADAIDGLAAAGRIVDGSALQLARSSVAIAVRRGSPSPRVATQESLRQTLQSARSIGYSTGPSGQALLRLFARWGIGDEIRPRLMQAPPGVAVGDLIQSGEVEIGFQQLSELMYLDGIEIVGPMPPGTEIDTIFSGAVCAGSRHPEQARALLEFIRSAEADDARLRNGMQPVVP